MPSYERTARAGITGATEHQRDQLCFNLHRRGWSLRKIGAHPNIQMSHVSVKHAIERVAGIPRVRRSPGRCASCGEAWPVGELTNGVSAPSAARELTGSKTIPFGRQTN
jgi:hypothetical protein